VCLGAFALAGGAAYGAGGSAQGPAGAVHGCVVKIGPAKGELRIVKGGAPCRRRERRLVWNVRGARGPAGEPGAAGTQGSPGQSGAQGTFSFDDFEGMACSDGTDQGTIHVTYDGVGNASFTC
jgi:hypothetical protein